MQNCIVSHTVVRNAPLQSEPNVIAMFKTFNPNHVPEPVEEEGEDEVVETKVVRRGRRPRVRSTEGAETK